jgi:hypothetical protein
MLVAARRAASTGALPWPAALIVWGPGALSSAHAHHCVQLVLALEGRLRVRPRPGSRWQRCHAVVISPDVQHEIDARNLPVLIGFIDAESSLATGLAGASAHAIAPVPAPVALRWRRVLGHARTLAVAAVEAWVRSELSLGAACFSEAAP